MPIVSKLENRVARVLDSVGIRYVRQYGLLNEYGKVVGVFDFWLPDIGILLEVNGTYWHADPRVYRRDRLTIAQRRNVAIWRRKVRFVKQVGIPLAVVWESDFNREGAAAVRDALLRKVG